MTYASSTWNPEVKLFKHTKQSMDNSHLAFLYTTHYKPSLIQKLSEKQVNLQECHVQEEKNVAVTAQNLYGFKNWLDNSVGHDKK